MHGTGSNIKKKNTSSLFSKIHKLCVGFLSMTQNSQRFCERLYCVPIKIRRLEMGGSYNKDGRREGSKKGSKWKLPHHKTSGKTKN